MPTQTLEEIVSGAQQFVRTSAQAATQKQENAKKAADIAGELSTTYQTVASDVAIVTATQQAAELKVQAQKSQIARAAGVDPETGASILVDLVTKQRKANAETEQALNDFRTKNETSFLSNPLDWVAAQVTLPIAEEKLKGAVQSSKLYDDQLTAVNNTLQNSFQTTEKLKESVTTTSAESATRIAAAQAVTESKRYQLEALKYNNIGIDEAMNATRDQLNALYNVFGAQKQEQQLQVSQETLALSKERFSFEKAFRQEQLDAKKDAKVLDESLLNKINVGRAASGMEPIAGPEAQFALTKLKSGTGSDMEKYYEIGDKVVSSGKISYGNTPADATRTLTSVPTNLPDIKKETSAVLSAAMSALQQSKTVDHKDKAAVDGFINKFVKDQVDQQYRSIVPGGQNLFDVGDLSSYLTLGSVKDLPVVTQVLAPLAQSKVSLNDPKMVLGFMKDAVKKGTLTTSQIADLSTVYRQANLVNQAARDFRSFGIVPPNNGKNYFAKVSPFGAPVDMTDPAALQNLMARRLAEDYMDQTGFGNAIPASNPGRTHR